MIDGWIDPNNKAQERYLPDIGDKCFFIHNGIRYYGFHTGGSFQSGHGATARHFDTWDCAWMPIPKHLASMGGCDWAHMIRAIDEALAAPDKGVEPNA